jgi:hypothetical protein
VVFQFFGADADGGGGIAVGAGGAEDLPEKLG